MQCRPAQAFWDKSIPEASCDVDIGHFMFATILMHTTLDLTILSLPVVQVLKMHLPLADKAGVVAVFASGIL